MKKYEKSKKSHKKRKADKTYGVGFLTNDDCNLITDRMEELANETCNKIDDHNNNLVRDIMDLLQSLCVLVK